MMDSAQHSPLLLAVMVSCSFIVAASTSPLGGLGGFMRPRPLSMHSLVESDDRGNATITQKLDHFDPHNNATWQQRYFFNFEHRRTNTAVNFLVLGGEGPEFLEKITIEQMAVVNYSKIFGASLYSLEHRYYGESHPTADVSLGKLKFLSSRQALEDAAAFIRKINAKESSGDAPKWVLFGTSYSGNLAMWFREKYPDLAVGAVGSSAPILAQLDFTGYLQVVAEDIRKVDIRAVNKTTKCATQVQQAFKEASLLLKTEEGRAKLSDLFKITPSLNNYTHLDENTISFLFFNLIRVDNNTFYVIVPMHVLVQIKPPFFAAAQSRGFAFMKLLCEGDVNYSSYIRDLRNTTWSTSPFSLINRPFVYQKCTEFGYIQSTGRDNVIFGYTIPMSFELSVCEDVYGVGFAQIKGAVDATNTFYGGRNNYEGTNVVTTYGTFDPWGFLNLKKSHEESVVVIRIKDGTHGSDTGSACESNSTNCNEEVLKAQRIIIKNIKSWLK